jgi:hypothetical protein
MMLDRKRPDFPRDVHPWLICIEAIALSRMTPYPLLSAILASIQATSTRYQGQPDDWIELYNLGAASIDVGGMYLTDNLSRRRNGGFHRQSE